MHILYIYNIILYYNIVLYIYTHTFLHIYPKVVQCKPVNPQSRYSTYRDHKIEHPGPPSSGLLTTLLENRLERMEAPKH